MDLQTTKTNQSLIKAEEMRNETKLVMQPYVNWEEYLSPAPFSIAIMGELVFISSKEDFSINKNAPKDGFKYIRYPESFRACLMQVCNSGWGAFNEAHKNMDQIRLQTMAVPDYINKAMKILFQGNDKVVQLLLKHQLKSIDTIANDCLGLASATEQKFTDVINIIQELLEACTNAKHDYGKELDAIKKKMEDAKLKEQSSEEAAKRSEKAMKEIEEQLKQAYGNYNKAMDSLPRDGEMNVIEAILTLFSKSNGKFRVEQSRDHLYKTRQDYMKSVEDMEKNQKEMNEILSTMRNCEIEEIDFNTAIQMLIQGMDVMGRVKVQWEKMVHFFQMVSTIVKYRLDKILKDFVSTSEITQELSHSDKLSTKDQLYQEAFQAINIVGLIHMISGTYTEVSTKHIIDHVSSLGELMAMDKDKDKKEFERKQKRLQESCNQAQNAILELVLKNKEEFEKESAARLAEIDQELLAILPADDREFTE